MRLFFAAMLPDRVQQQLGKLRRQLDWIPTRPTWSPTQNLHITLKFLGEVEDSQVNDLALSVGAAIPRTGPLTLRPSQLVFFPPAGTARVLAVGFDGDTQPLIDIQQQIEAACSALGFEKERRGYTPHATLARFKDGLRPVHRPRIEECCSAISRMPPFTIDTVQLMHSKLSSRGSEYAVAASYPLVP